MDDQLEKACKDHGIKYLKLINDVPTRWNSTYSMISRALVLEEALRPTIQFCKELKEHELSDEDWGTLKSIASMLKVSKWV